MEEAKLKKKKMSGYGRLTFLTENVLFENCPRDLPRITFVVSWNRSKFSLKDTKDKTGQENLPNHGHF